MTDVATLAAAQRALAEGRPREAADLTFSLLASSPGDERLLRLRALALTALDDSGSSAAWQRLLDVNRDDGEALYHLGTLAGDRGDFAQAAALLERALSSQPRHPQILNNLALALEAAGSLPQAQARFEQLLQAHPALAPHVLPSLARVLFTQRRYRDALPVLDDLVRRYLPHDAASWAAVAVCLADARRDDESEKAYRRALELDPGQASVWHDFVRFLVARDRYEDAAEVLAQAHERLPHDLLIVTLLAAYRLRNADWRDVDTLRSGLVDAVSRAPIPDDQAVPAYDFLALCDEPSLQLRVAQRWARVDARGAAPLRSVARRASGRLRLGFVSSDFGNHPVSRLLIGLLERLDRARFEVFAYATADDRDTPQRARIIAAVDHYRLAPRTDGAAAERMVSADSIDVLFDLNGFSGGEALALFSRRAAPLQVNFLGYPGTMGSTAYDYIACDAFCIPAEMRSDYVEQPLMLDPCYLPSDPARLALSQQPLRGEYGLPDGTPVYSAFAASYKIVPELFAAWMQLLRETPRSILWLRNEPALTIDRLREAAQGADVDPQRLAFAPAEPLSRYLARFALADVLLDTAPYGAHTTVNDALFVGLPVVTLAGRSFAARASASQLSTVGLPELIADSMSAYVAIAREIALDRDRGARLVAYLKSEGRRSALFDMERYARSFELAIERAVEERRS